MLTVLRSADARVDEAGGLELRMIPGRHLDRLRAGEGKALEEALARAASHPVPLRLLEIDPSRDAPDGGIDSAAVREGRLRDLLEREPGLQPAVQVLDLELMD